ncbi:MAG: hypothetical protein H6657_02205 [Ardenticatenaceae bacterium]|nr:hypothetical protein [Anaerolineales bacterium]MCB8976222.1 hypothetical protein [Ardenticatenaceae bacterium]
MPSRNKFHWARRVSRIKIRRLYESEARGMLDEELLDKVHYAIYARVCDMFEVRQAQKFGRVTCRKCNTAVPEPFQMGASNKSNLLRCEKCGWQVTCGEYYDSYTGKSLLPGSATSLFTRYLEQFPKAQTAQQKMLLIDWLIHQFHMLQGVPRMPVCQNVIQGTAEQVRELLETLATGPDSLPQRIPVADWREVYYNPVRLFKQEHSHSQVQKIAAELEIQGRSQMPEEELIPEILRRAPELTPKTE